VLSVPGRYLQNGAYYPVFCLRYLGEFWSLLERRSGGRLYVHSHPAEEEVRID